MHQITPGTGKSDSILIFIAEVGVQNSSKKTPKLHTYVYNSSGQHSADFLYPLFTSHVSEVPNSRN